MPVTPHGQAAGALQTWWISRETFRTKRQLAAAIGIDVRTLIGYFNGSSVPEGRHCDLLYEFSGVDYLFPSTNGQAVLWARDLLAKADRYIGALTDVESAKSRLRRFAFQALQRVVQDGICGPAEITPQVLIQHPPRYRSKKSQRQALGFFGRFLVEEQLWNEHQQRELSDLVSQCYRGIGAGHSTGSNHRNARAVLLVKELVLNCGLSTKEIRALRVSQIKPDGIPMSTHKFVKFGEERHCVSKSALDAWLSEARPKDYLFYRNRPRDHSKPVSPSWIVDVIKNFGVKVRRSRSIRTDHFEEDSNRFQDMRALHLHFRHFHGLSYTQSWALTKSLVEKANTFAVPEPYLLAVICASRLLPSSPEKRQGGRVSRFVWPTLLGRYDVEVSWPFSLAQDLAHQQTAESVARLLYRLAYRFWSRGWKLRGGVAFDKRERCLLDVLEKTNVEVRDKDTGDIWVGAAIKIRASSKHSRKLYLFSPLIESFLGGTTKSSCAVCMHSNREAIDEQLRQAHKKGGKGYNCIAREYGVPGRDVLWHAGRLNRKQRQEKPSRVEWLAGHMAMAPPAPTLRCPKKFVQCITKLDATELVLYSLLLLAGAERAEVSPTWVKQQVGLDISEHELSRRLNHLDQENLVKCSLKVPAGFPVSLVS